MRRVDLLTGPLFDAGERERLPDERATPLEAGERAIAPRALAEAGE